MSNVIYTEAIRITIAIKNIILNSFLDIKFYIETPSIFIYLSEYFHSRIKFPMAHFLSRTIQKTHSISKNFQLFNLFINFTPTFN